MNKEKLIREFLSKPLQVGDLIKVGGKTGHVVSINDNIVHYNCDGTILVTSINDIKKDTLTIGYDPFPTNRIMIRRRNSVIGAIYHTAKSTEYTIKEYNLDPYVYDKDGQKIYFQRGYIWTEKQKQRLIQSIINDVEISSILVHEHKYKKIADRQKNGETELFLSDVIDGKQRLSTIISFMDNDFAVDGVYYKDWSALAQRKWKNKTISVNTVQHLTDKQVLEQFLKVNFAGTQQSEEHMENVKKFITLL